MIERVIATPDADDQAWCSSTWKRANRSKPPFPLTFRANQGPAFVELGPS